MSRKTDANQRAWYRWEFVRRNASFKMDYNRLFSSPKDDLMDLSMVDDQKIEYFIKKHLVYPLNPRYSYAQVLDEHRKMAKFLTDHIKDAHRIYEKYLGKDWVEKNVEFMAYESQVKRDSNKKGRKFNIKVYLSAKNKADVEVDKLKCSINYDLILNKRCYINKVLHQLSSIKLSPTKADIFSSHTTVINSYLASNHNIEAYRYDHMVGLVDSTIQKGDKTVSGGNKDLSKVCFEIDLSYPTKDILEDIKKEISKWKMVERKFYQGKRNRQNLYPKDVQKALEIFDLKEEGVAYKDIARNSTPEAIQKTMNMYKKAKKFIEGEYKQIR